MGNTSSKKSGGKIVPVCYLAYYDSLLEDAFHQTVGVAKLEELPLTLLLGVLGAACYRAWKKYMDRAPMSDWKALLFAAVAPVLLVFGVRFLWEMTVVPVERQQAVEQAAARNVEEIKMKSGQTIDGLKSQIESLKANQNSQKTISWLKFLA